MKNKRYYIAYGSNLSIEQMALRCPTAKLIGTAIIENYALAFKVHATIVPKPNHKVPVAVWEIQEEDEKSLDLYEGYPRYYYKEEMRLPVKMIDGSGTSFLDAMVYIMAPNHSIALPDIDYYKVLEEGYKHFKFDIRILLAALEQAFFKKN